MNPRFDIFGRPVLRAWRVAWALGRARVYAYSKGDAERTFKRETGYAGRVTVEKWNGTEKGVRYV